ncbi:hypothetical protein SDC9_146799 [bioreactor metagenome]|uniref:Uncharacterized protein n=1 Tax=bioreactor metagenome TaxID=1076179 RepID=A0A645ECA2_9ZZZZ
MSGLAAGRRTGIQHAQRAPLGLGQAGQQQWGRGLCRAVLHRCPAFFKMRQLLYRHGLLQLQTALGDGRRLQVHLLQRILIPGCSAFLCIHAQRHGRLGIVGRQNGLPIPGMVFPEPGNPPGRVIPDGHWIAVGRAHQGIALAQKAAQAGIDETGLRACRAILGGFHGLVDQGEGRIRGLRLIPGQSQRRAQQGTDLGCRCARRQLLLQRLGTSQIAQHLEQQGLHSRTQALRHLCQHSLAGLATQDAVQGLGHCIQLLPQGRSVGYSSTSRGVLGLGRLGSHEEQT